MVLPDTDGVVDVTIDATEDARLKPHLAEIAELTWPSMLKAAELAGVKLALRPPFPPLDQTGYEDDLRELIAVMLLPLLAQ